MGDPTSTVNYGYTDSSWGDLLTTYNSQTIEYDEIGNPLSVTDAQGNVVKSYTWERGRQLKTLTKGATTWTYTYDTDGLRTGRTDGTNTFEYIYAGDKLVRLVKNGEVVDFGYAGGQLATMSYDGATYYYVLNGQGDVVALTDNTGKMIIGYHYSAYGFPTLLKTDSETYNDLKYLNPFMYRGYVFDIETKFYYLQSRYYDPELGRFINADAYASTGQGILGNNMFAYCYNNPANMYDVEGTDAIWIQEPNSAIYNGHSGLLVQDKYENWYYFFWGPVGEELPDVITGTQSRCIVIQVFPEDGSLDSLEDVKNAIANLSNQYPNYADAEYAAERAELIGAIMYLEGDYSATYEYLVELQKRSATQKYRLLTNNCVQYTCIALGQSNDYFNRIPNVVRPNVVFYLTVLQDLADQPVYFSEGK